MSKDIVKVRESYFQELLAATGERDRLRASLWRADKALELTATLLAKLPALLNKAMARQLTVQEYQDFCNDLTLAGRHGDQILADPTGAAVVAGWRAMEQENRRLRKALEQWKCHICGGTGRQKNAAGEHWKCSVCGGSGQSPIAAAALAAEGGSK